MNLKHVRELSLEDLVTGIWYWRDAWLFATVADVADVRVRHTVIGIVDRSHLMDGAPVPLDWRETVVVDGPFCRPKEPHPDAE